MKKLILTSILTLILIALMGCSTETQNVTEPFPTEVVTDLQMTMDNLTASELTPGMVVWIDTPEHRFEGASGSADLSADVPMPADGAFRIGSITKMFTAAVVVQLVEDGVLTLDD
ncbi:MAG: serine hydrolase domain-containing protein, partial [Chloroflexota bacterium]